MVAMGRVAKPHTRNKAVNRLAPNAKQGRGREVQVVADVAPNPLHRIKISSVSRILL